MWVPASELFNGDVLQGDIKTTNGRVILAEGALLTRIQIARIRGFVQLGLLAEPFAILRDEHRTANEHEMRW